ncbi:MAG: diacylglycerol kinase family protein [Propionibacteriaceae bacterium]|nr:diacylglycerol kinase family protein [Propionibacteriaceae bacterium]
MTFTALILNPTHDDGATVAETLSPLPDIRVWETTADAPGQDQVRQALEAGASAVLVAGGDGTQRLVAGALAASGVPLGILATGTACVYARNLGLPLGTAGLDIALSGTPRAMDLGWARLDDGEAQPFLVAAGVGRDAETIGEVRDDLKEKLGWMAYAQAGLTTAGRGALPMRINDEPVTAWSVLIGNIGEIPMASMFPDAAPDDGLLHVMHLGVNGWLDWAPVALAGLTRSRTDMGKMRRWETDHIVVTTKEPTAVHLDGDELPAARKLEVWLEPGALQVRCQPSSTAS